MIGSSLRHHVVSASSRRSLVLTARLMQVKPAPSSPVTPPQKAPEIPQQPPKDVKQKIQENNENPQNKKKFSFTGFFFKAILLSSAVYGATLFAATKSDTVMDFVIDKQLPYYEELIDIIENGSVEDLKKKWESLSSNVQLPSKEKLEELTSKLEQQGEQLLEETKKKFQGGQPAKTASKPSGYVTPTEQLQKPVAIESITSVTEKLPQIKLKGGPTSYADDTVKATVKSFNDLIILIDGSSIGPHKEALVRAINDNINNLSAKLNSLNTSFEKELRAKLKSSQTELLSSYTQKELELTQNLLDQFSDEKAALDKKYLAKLTKEVSAAKEAISQAAVNATSMVRIEQTKRFEKMVKDKIDAERNGRLQNLENVNTRLESLEKFALSLENQITASSSKTAIQRSLSNLKSLLVSTTETTPAKALKPYVDELEIESAKADDEVIKLALSELKPLLAGESSQSILTIPQLLTAWEQLTPELRSASLLPPNAGLLGHLASSVFSKLLLPVKGAKPDGKDIESVIGRVEQSLTRGNLDVAVEEVANLKGWTRKLADDWVREGRKRLEAEFLVSLIDAETKIL